MSRAAMHSVYSLARRFTVYSAFPFSSREPIPTYKLSKLLLLSYVALDLLLLGVGITFTALSFAWMNANAIHSMVLTELDLLAGLVLGGLFTTTFLISLPALLHSLSLSPKRAFTSTPLVFLNLALFVDQMAVIVIGAIIWWRTLEERSTFFQVWQRSDDAFRKSLEDKFNCCGYFTACPNAGGGPALPVCVDPITGYADKILNILFTSMFATSAIIILFLLCSGCMISELRVLNRYRRIDIKRGKVSAA